MKKKRSGILTKILLVLLLAISVTSLVNMSEKIKAAQDHQKELEEKAQQLEQEKAELEFAIENSDNEEVIENIARDELGLVYPGEKVFIGD